MDKKEELKEDWMYDNSSQCKLLGNNILGLNPIYGKLIRVESIDIHESVFPEEYNIIRNAYQKILNEMEKYDNKEFKIIYERYKKIKRTKNII